VNLPELSIKRPIFVTCIVILMVAVGVICMRRLPVDLFPNIEFPIVVTQIGYPGAGPQEIETLISRPVEDQLSTISGLKTLRSVNREGAGVVIAEFTLETDIKYAEQQVRDKISSVKGKLPDDILEPVIRRVDPAEQPILIVAVTGDLNPAQLFDLADDTVRPKLEQVPQVGLVEVVGGRKREIHVNLDRNKLKNHEISASMVASRIAAAGQNIPVGRVDEGKKETVFRALAEFKTLKDISDTVVNFAGNDVPVTVGTLGVVEDSLVDENSRVFANGKKSVFLMVFRQSGSNTISVSEGVRSRLDKINEDLKKLPGNGALSVVRDTSKMIAANVTDVKESIFIGIVLTLLVVYLFLGSARSTFITGIALPNSLLGAFLLMALAGFTINVMSLLALSLAVGLLVDDAIVVRENIFRHMELGSSPKRAASEGTQEVLLAVVATTATVIAVFGPIGFLQGVVGRFFREFGLTVCFAMAISLFDAVTMAPMLSAYFGGMGAHGAGAKRGWFGPVLDAFDRFQEWLADRYQAFLKVILRHRTIALGASFGIFVLSLVAASKVPKTFLPPQDSGEFGISLETAAGTNLDTMQKLATEVDEIVRKNSEVETSVLTVGTRDGESFKASFFISLVPSKQRALNTSQMKDKIREQLTPYKYAKPLVKDIDNVGGGQRPFNINIAGSDLKEVEEVASALFAKIKDHPAVKDPELSNEPGKPEFQAVVDTQRAEKLGVSPTMLGQELRTLVEGNVPAVFREEGREYDIRVRLQEDQRNLKEGYEATYVPNVNQSLVRLSKVTHPVEMVGRATINRQDRGRYIQISSDLTPDGPGMGALMSDIKNIMENDIKMPPGVTYTFVGQAENFKELLTNMMAAAGLGILFIYLVLASLYESFITPFTIMLVLPLAACGAFYALFITGKSLDIFSMIGCIMLLGVATKNSILLVDYANQLVAAGKDRTAAILEAGRVRLRPILMTSIALVAGMLPVAIGLNEASKQRTSMGVAIIGGLISSTLLTLIVIPAAFSFMDRFREWVEGKFRRPEEKKSHRESPAA
jgi:hydrophobic/amphiphilic exporter-1 (mainly G- bacteria), HAE1 family